MKTGLWSVGLNVLLLATTTAAWGSSPKVDGNHGNFIRREDKSSSDDAASSQTVTATASSGATASITASSTSDTASTKAASSSGTSSGTADSKTSATSSKTTKTSSTSISANLPPGGIDMITPGATADATYYKIGDYVTFAWNYTSLSVTPSAIDIMASCSLNDQMYTIALNQSVEATGAVTWDTGGYQSTATIPLLTETYTLVIYDANADGGVSATAQAGYLSVADTYTFGMYVKQAYSTTPSIAFTCISCSGAMSDMERHALGFTFGMAAITILSFTWFAGGFGVFN